MASNDEDYMLTTVDNPWDPFTQFNEWFAWDAAAGYNTPGLIARLLVSSDELSDADQAIAINDAINDIVELNASGVHLRVARNDYAAT